MAGRTNGDTASEDCFRDNLNHACDLAAARGIGVLIEPINTRDVAGYHLSGTLHAERIIYDLARPELKIMFDCYHMQIMQGDLAETLDHLMPIIGHIQIAAVPDRGEPDSGEVDYSWLMAHLAALGYQGYVGAEYHPKCTTEAGLGWMQRLRNAT